MTENPYVTNHLRHHDIGGVIVGTAPCGYEFSARVRFAGFTAPPCEECFPAALTSEETDQ